LTKYLEWQFQLNRRIEPIKVPAFRNNRHQVATLMDLRSGCHRGGSKKNYSTKKNTTMCFSATASFGASVVLTATGMVSRTKMISPEQKPFASIPFIFAAQQFTEGLLWISFSNPEFSAWRTPSTFLFLIFAQIVWPLWVPFAILKLEGHAERRKILTAFVGIGALVSCYLAYCLFTYPVQASIMGNHIHYEQFYPIRIQPFSAILYVVLTVVSMFVSSVNRMPILGLAILSSLLVTLYFHSAHVISVWCFLAAMLSVIVLAILSHQQKIFNREHPAGAF
jgi:hypothetical protein